MKSLIKRIYDYFDVKFISYIRRRKLVNRKFTIISNNCWAGDVYRKYNLQYATPTIGLFILPNDYLNLIENLEYYLGLELKKSNVKESENYSKYISLGVTESSILGKLDNVEILFLHYSSFEEAKLKWDRRVKRINYENIIFKLNDQNGCRMNDIERFNDLNLQNKPFFSSKQLNLSNVKVVHFREFENNLYVKNDTSRKIYRKYIDTTLYLNKTINQNQEKLK